MTKAAENAGVAFCSWRRTKTKTPSLRRTVTIRG
jgi:hypothetical protein